MAASLPVQANMSSTQVCVSACIHAYTCVGMRVQVGVCACACACACAYAFARPTIASPSSPSSLPVFFSSFRLADGGVANGFHDLVFVMHTCLALLG